MSRTPDAGLTLEVVGEVPSAPGTERRKTFGALGGTIGRAATNFWVLADDYVSNRHARIRYENGTFLIEDTSTNGVYVNGLRLEKGRPHPVASGDRVCIEPFEMVAAIEPLARTPAGSPARGVAARNPFEVDDSSEMGRVAPSGPVSPFGDVLPGVVPEPAAGDELDWFNALGPAPARRPESGSRSRSVPGLGNNPLKEHHAAPAVPLPPPPARASAFIPEGYDPITDTPPVAGPVRDRPTAERRIGDRRGAPERGAGAKPPASSPGPVASGSAGAAEHTGRGGGSDLAAVLAGAGLGAVPVTPELAREFGQILRVVVAGVLDVLQARQQTKGEFRIANTVIQPARNNPLKYSVDVEDALHNLLLKRNPAYLGPVAAFEDAFNDLRHHQLAMLAGVRVAFEAMFGQFDPEHLQREFDRHAPRARKGALGSLQGKPDYWESYREWVRRMADDADGSFRTLFGEKFAKAYEDQLERLKAQAPGGRPRPSKGVHER